MGGFLALLIAWHDKGVEEAERLRFGLMALAFGALHSAGGYSILWRAQRPALWASLAATSVVGYFVLSYWVLRDMEVPLGWAAWSATLAVACAAAAVPVFRRQEELRQGGASLAALLVASTALAALAVPIELEREWIAVAWAFEIAALAWLEKRLGATVLRYLAAILALAVTSGLLLNPSVLDYPTGTRLPWNWVLYGYGLPAASLFWAASTYRSIDGTSSKPAEPSGWIPSALELLAVGIATGGAVVRYASLVVMMASVAKVFLFDTSELQNLYRVFSFLGLGVSLFLLAYLYQRFVFRQPRS